MSHNEEAFWIAVLNGNLETAKTCLAKDQSLAGKDFEPESAATSGFPIYHASQQGNLELVQWLLESGADPDAKKADAGDPREIGMPLMHAINTNNFAMIRMLLDAGATVWAHPNCDVPFVSRLYTKSLAAGAPKMMVLKGFSNVEPERLAKIPAVGSDAPEVIQVWDRVLSLGGVPNHYAIAIAQDYETIEWLLRNRPTEKSRDHWGANVHEALLYGSAWHGDARTVELCMDICAAHHTSYASAHCIRNAITSHNRKGKFEDYRRTIELSLRFLKEKNALYEHDFFLPYHWLADKFISDFYYGSLGELPTSKHQLVLAQICLAHGLDVNHNVAGSESALALAIAEGHQEYAKWLRANGAEEPDAVRLQVFKEEVFWKRMTSGHPQRVKRMLRADSSLALKNYEPESPHTDGFPLYQATKQGDFEMIEMILDAGADPDAKLATDDPREIGMPLINAFEYANTHAMEDYANVHLILRYQPELNAHPYCSMAFVDSLFNNMWDKEKNFAPGEPYTYRQDAGAEVAKLFRDSYANYLSDVDDATTSHTISNQFWCQCDKCERLVFLTKEIWLSGRCSCGHKFDLGPYDERFPDLELLRTVIEMGGQPSLFTLVRHEQHDLIADLLENAPSEPGAVMDRPRGTVFANIVNGASWCGNPKTIVACMDICPDLYSPDQAKHVIERAIRSHNRDGDIEQYYELIESQLVFLKEKNAISEKSDNGDPFLPLHWIAEDFIEPSHYGFKCKRLGTEEDIVRLGRLFLKYGFEVNSISPKSKLSVLATAESKGFTQYVDLLKQNGAS